jgi:LPXTG-motif cell wall-anchored protein
MWITVTPREVSVVPGDVVDIAITIGNDGPQDAGDPQLQILLPPRTEPVSVPDECRASGEFNYDCPLGDLPFGGQIERTVSIEIAGFNIEDLRFNLTDADLTEAGGANNHARVVIHTAKAALWADLEPEIVALHIGEQVELTATIGNDGPRHAIDPVFFFQNDKVLEITALPASCESNNDSSIHICPVDALPAGGQVSVTITVRLLQADLSGQSRVLVTALDRATNESATASAIVSGHTTSDVFLEATPMTVVIDDPPEPFEISVTVGNAGPNIALIVETSFAFPASTAGASLVPLLDQLPNNCQRSFTVPPPLTIHCEVSQLPVGESVEVTLPVEIAPGGGNLYNIYEVPVTVRLQASGETEELRHQANNSATLAVEGVPPQAASPSPPAPGGSGGTGGLPVTGSNVTGLAAIGFALLGAGTILSLLARRRHSMNRVL